MSQEPDYYALLEIPPDADEATIRLAFRRLARRYHPDVAGTGSVALMQQLNVAYQTLSDPERRRIYDEQRAPYGAGVSVPFSPTASTTGDVQKRQTAPRQPHAGPRQGLRHNTPGPFRRVEVLDAGEDVPIAALAFARDGMQAGIGLIDGRIHMWDSVRRHITITLSFGDGLSAGVLQELRLSPAGTFAAAWGFQLGMRIWRTGDGRGIWNTAINGPSGVMDAILLDAPPLLRLALPDAPLALADDDPFRWAHEGRRGTAILARPLRGPVDPAWATPLHCAEAGGGGVFSDSRDPHWRVHQRNLSSDGRFLFTFSTGRTARVPRARVLHIWELDHKTLLGAAQPRRIARVAEPADNLQFPLAVTPDLGWIAVRSQGRQMRLFNPRRGEQRTIPADRVPEDARAALSPGGEYLAIARDAQLDLWETRSGRNVEQWQFTTEITAVSFALSGQRPLFGVGLRNGVAEVWGQ